MVSTAIAAGDKAAINYFLGQRYVDAFEKLALSDQQRVLILPAELSGLSALLGGIGEIAKSALSPNDRNGAARPTTGPVPPTAGDSPWSR